MTILHDFANESEVVKLFSDVEKFPQFKNKLKKLSKTLPKTNPIDWNLKSNQQDNENKILGDGFELFCELLVLHMGFHPHIGLASYKPIDDPGRDEGVDAYALNLDGEKSAVQCKFVSDPKHIFTANGSNLPNFLVEANFKNIEFKDKKIKRLFLITTAQGLHHHTIKKWHNSVHVINNKVISQLTDNNKIFWNSCKETVRKNSGV